MRKSVIYSLVISVLMSLVLINTVRANPVFYYILPWEHPEYAITWILVGLFITVVAEFGVVFFFTETVAAPKKKIFYSVFLVNLVTFPPSQLTVYFILLYFEEWFWLVVLLVEIGVILIEWPLYHSRFQKSGSFTFRNTRKMLVMTIVANCVSFLIGLLILIISSQGYFLFNQN